MEQRDVRLGNATLAAHPDGGWALPGGGITHCHVEAMAVAAELDAMIGGREVPKRAGEKLAAMAARQPVVVTRRKGGFFSPVYNRV